MSAAATLSGSSMSPSGPGPGEVATLAPPGAPTSSDLFDFLRRAELEQYYRPFVDELKVTNPNQVKYCEDEDLMEIGMSRPQMRRLKKFFLRECPQTQLGKLRKRLSRSSSSRTHRTTPPRHSPSSEEGGTSLDHLNSHRSMIPSEQLEMGKILGEGEFGRVYQGVWRPGQGPPVQVAIKVLERLDASTSVDFLKEVNNMHGIEHRNVVRLYGVAVEDDVLKMVTELASLRSLLECLKEPGLRSSITVPVLCDFAEQIAEGMRYLESQRLIHRDLAARNILVFSKDRVKISDFGMSRALQLGKEYYQTNYNLNLKLPIAWCAPECINYLRFTSSSDVWAYGVTLWEMFSYGFQPWAGLTGEQILTTIDAPASARLDRPDLCPKTYYDLMLRCWRHEAKERPGFDEIVSQIGLLRPDICRCIEDRTGVTEGLPLRMGESVVILDKNPTPSEDADESKKLWLGVTLGGPGNASGGVRGLFPSAVVKMVPQRMSGNTLRSGVMSPSLKSRFNRRGGSKDNLLDQAGGVRRSARVRLRADMISLPQDDFRHTGHIGYDGSAFGDVAFIQNSGGKGSDAVRPSIKSSCISSRSLAGSSGLSSASSMVSLNSGVTSVLGGGGGGHVRFRSPDHSSRNGNSPTDSITTVSDWTGSQSTLTDDGDSLPMDERSVDHARSKDDTDLLSDFSIPTLEQSSLDFGGLMDDIFKSLNMEETNSAPASNGNNSPVSTSTSSAATAVSVSSPPPAPAPTSALAAATAVAAGRISPDSDNNRQSVLTSARTSIASELEDEQMLTGSSTVTSFDMILQPQRPSPVKKQEAIVRPMQHPKVSSSSTTSVLSSSSGSSAGSTGSPHSGRNCKLFPSLFSSSRGKGKTASGSGESKAPVISGPISAPIIERVEKNEDIYAIPNKPYIRAKTLGITGNSSSSESVSSRKSGISKPMISAPIEATSVQMKSSTIGGDSSNSARPGVAAFRVGGGSGRRPSASGMSRSAFGPRRTDYSSGPGSGTLSSMSSTLRSLRRHSSADKKNDDDGGTAVAGLSIEQLGMLSSSDTSDSFWGCDFSGAFKQIGSGRDSDEGENCYEELSDQESTLTRTVLTNGNAC